jgi:hypothetical protein
MKRNVDSRDMASCYFASCEEAGFEKVLRDGLRDGNFAALPKKLRRWVVCDTPALAEYLDFVRDDVAKRLGRIAKAGGGARPRR